ncbi:hypothetical protein AGMMS49992_31590 [Clostridia bacterium]|nr:hypothetical protein AGMMS49992_31590 [Clostridia bacterium]
MQAFEGFYENGRFAPSEKVEMPIKAKAILLLYNSSALSDREEAKAFWRKFDELVDSASNEIMPDFPRMQFGRDIELLADEGNQL